MPAKAPMEDPPSSMTNGSNMPEYLYQGEVAISGISGRMPESHNMQEFRDHLMNMEDMVTEDNRRWEVGESVCELTR